MLKDEVGFDAKEAMRRLAEKGIGTRPFFWCMHEQPVLRKAGLFANDSHPNAERIARRGFYLPSGLALTDDQIVRSARGAEGDSCVTVFEQYAPWYDLLYQDKDYASEVYLRR